MNEPLFWNPLPEAAKWLSEKTGRAFDARALIDLIVNSEETNAGRTIIKAVLPVNAEFAKINMGMAPPSESVIEINQEKNQKLIDRFGKLPFNMHYITEVYALEIAFLFSDEPSARFNELNEDALLRLLIDGFLDINVLTSTINLAKHEMVCLMPFGTTHRATIETCGINRDDLIKIGDRLVKKYAPEPPKYELRANGSPVKWEIRALELANNIWLDNLREQKKITKRWLGHEIYGVLKKESYLNARRKQVSLDSIAKFLNDWNEPELK